MSSTVPVLHHRHAGLTPRQGFLPPVYRVQPWGAEGLAGLAPVAWLGDSFGEERPVGCRRLALGWDGEALMVHGEIAETHLVVHPERNIHDPRFWEQDHLELRLLPDASRDLDQIQVLLAASGELLLARPGQAPVAGKTVGMTCQVTRHDTGWTLTARLPWAALGLAVPLAGSRLRGLLAHTRWGGGYAEIACLTPAQLGFSHAERFAEFEWVDGPDWLVVEELSLATGPLLAGDNPGHLHLICRGQAALAGRLILQRDTGDLPGGLALSQELRLLPGRNRVPVTLPLARPRYTRWHLRCQVPDGRILELGAVTLRAGIPRLPGVAVSRLPAPRLLFDATGLAALRQKFTRPYFAPLAETLRQRATKGLASQPPADPSQLPLTLSPDDGNWLRVARETFLSRGQRGASPATSRLWQLLGPAGQESARAIDRTVAKDPAAVSAFLAACNAMLLAPDFYQAAAFERLALPAETRAALATGAPALSERERLRHHRIVFQAAVECVKEFKLDFLHQAVELLDPWLLTDDPTLLTRATDWLAAAEACVITHPHVDLHTGGLCAALARAWDCWGPLLSQDQRRVWLRVLRRFLHLYLATARARHWNCTAIPNANPVCNGGGGLLAMSLLADFPEEASEALYFARKFIWNWLDYCHGTDGGNTEGAQYWQYGCENFLPFALAVERLLGHDDGLLSHPAITRMMAMVRVGLSNDGGMHGLNDTIPLPVGGVLAWYCASRHGDALGLWYGDHAERYYQARLARQLPTPYRAMGTLALLLRPDLSECHDQPPLPTALVVPDIAYGILRSGTAWNCPLVAGMKGSRAPYTHHNQPDTGAIFVDLRGERLLLDPGYYKSAPKHHCLPIVDGVAPLEPVGTVGWLQAAEGDGWRYLRGSVSAAWRGATSRFERHLFLLGETTVVLLDDLVVPAGQPGAVLAQYQCGGPVTPQADGAGLVIAGQAARLRLSFLGPAQVSLACLPERDLHDTHWGYHFAECRHFPVTLAYQAQAEHPLITVMQDASAADPGPVRLVSTPERLELHLAGQPALTFVATPAGWRPLLVLA